MVQTNGKATGIYPPYHEYPTLEMGLLGVRPKNVSEYQHYWDEVGTNWDDDGVTWDATV